jgi:hypothetical protein
VTGGAGLDAAAVIARVSVACGVNPRVMLVTLQKESRLLNRTDPTPGSYAAAWGWHCPDTGPGGTANCDPAYAGLVNQAYGMAKQWSRYRTDPDKYTYRAGQTANILFNVAESGCGVHPSPSPTRRRRPVQLHPVPAEPGVPRRLPRDGDQCSSYGNRNFFSSTRTTSGPPAAANPHHPGGTRSAAPAPTVELPRGRDHRHRHRAHRSGPRPRSGPRCPGSAPRTRGAAATARAPPWASGTAAPGCARASRTGTITGFDCSGLTLYAWARAGVALSHGSYDQVNQGHQLPYAQALPGDLLFWGGSEIHHVALYLGHN